MPVALATLVGLIALCIEHPTRSAVLRYAFPPLMGHVSLERRFPARYLTTREPGSRRELANSPPFETIARKFSNAPELIAFAILSPHPRMNLTPAQSDAQDIAAYIATLAK
jgi:hypothetical protein